MHDAISEQMQIISPSRSRGFVSFRPTTYFPMTGTCMLFFRHTVHMNMKPFHPDLQLQEPDRLLSITTATYWPAMYGTHHPAEIEDLTTPASDESEISAGNFLASGSGTEYLNTSSAPHNPYTSKEIYEEHGAEPRLLPDQGMDYQDSVSEVPDNSKFIDDIVFEESHVASALGHDAGYVFSAQQKSLDPGFCTYSAGFEMPFSIPTETLNGSALTMPELHDNNRLGSNIIRPSTSASEHMEPSCFSRTVAAIDDFQTDSRRWHATQSRLRAADHFFLYGVLTTKIFCRPSCASRRPSRRYVRFFPFPGAVEAAENAKFRACRRCRPEVPNVKTPAVASVCEVLRTINAGTFQTQRANSKAATKLESLAKLAGLSTFHFHRLFKATTRIALGDFVNACRALALQDTLCNSLRPGDFDPRDPVALVESLSGWSPRAARKALGGINPVDFAKGIPSRSLIACSAESPYGHLRVILSVDKNPHGPKVHAVFLTERASQQESMPFPKAQASPEYDSALQECVNELQKECGDRDTEITAHELPLIWRVRVWLRFLQE